MSFIQSMSISRESMMNTQLALTVVSHNIANINTAGYSKQRLSFVESTTPYSSGTLIGTIYGMNGSRISDITSYSNQTINTTVRNANSKSEYFTQLNSMLANLETITNDLGDEGLQKVVEDFFTSAQNLSKSPTDSSTRLAYVQSAKNIALKLNSVYNSAEEQKADIAGTGTNTANSKIDIALQEANIKLRKVADLNAQILQVGLENGSANSLIDERTMVLDELSSIMPVYTTENTNGTVNVMLDNIKLVSGAVFQKELACAPVNNPDCPIKIQTKSTETGEVTGDNLNSIFGERGAIGAMLTMVTSNDGFISLNKVMEQLDTLANSIANAVNEVQTYNGGDIKACYLSRDGNGNTILAYDPAPPDLFVGTGAKGIKINDEIIQNTNLVATARTDTNPATNPNWEQNVGNNTNVLLMAELRSKNIVDSSGLGNPHDSTIESFLSSLTLKLGVQAKDIETKKDTNEAILATYATERQGIVGVNMDEELADMIRYQRSYEASARIFSAVNEAMQVLINLGR